MKTHKTILASAVFALAFVGVVFVNPVHVYAAACDSSHCDLIKTYVNPLINLLSAMFGLIAVASIIMGGIQYAASEGDPQKAAQAKSRIYNTLIAIFAYLFLYAFLQFLVPGGFLHR